MRVLVTGGAGYVGSTTAAVLLTEGHEVTVVDNLGRGHRDLIPEAARFIEEDVGEPGRFAEALAEVDACLHFAASIEAGESMQRPEAFFAENAAATFRLLAALIGAGVDRFVLSSTAAVYGEPTRVPIDEDDPTEPVNVYGVSKLLIEQALPWLADLRGLRFASLRYFNASGATGNRGEDHHPETHLIPIVLQVAAGRRKEIAIYGTDYDTPDGTCVRDYVHVADLADAHIRALEALDTRPQIICNLGSGRGFSVQEVVESARRVTGHPIPTRETERRPGDPAVLVASYARARDMLGWEPSRTLDDIIGSAWDWHRRRWGSPVPPAT